MEKKQYNTPQLELIELDNEISLALESAPPEGPNEFTSLAPKHINCDPFKMNHG